MSARVDEAGRRFAMAACALVLSPWAMRGLALLESNARFDAADLRGFAADLGVAALVLGLLHWLPMWRRPVALCTAIGFAALYVANYEVVRVLRAVLRFEDVRFLGDATFAAGSAAALSHPVATVALLAVVGACAGYGFRGGPTARGSALSPITAGLLLLGGVAAFESDARVAGWRQVNVVTENIAARLRSGATESVPDGGVVAVSPDLAGVLDGEPRIRWDPNQANVLLVVLEGVSGVDLPSLASAHGRRAANPLPRLDAIARANLSFATFIHHNRRTNRGLFALLCGELPNLTGGMAKMTAVAAGGPRRCLPAQLRELGYRTEYLQAAPLAFMSKDEFLPRVGFDVVSGSEVFPDTQQRSVWGVDDRSLFARATRTIDVLERRGTPWFLTLLTVGTHHPYVVPESAASAGGEAASARDAFRFLDRAVGEFVERLEASGVRGDTLVVITSDEAAALWPGTQEGLAAALTQNWGFLTVLLPGRDRARVDEAYAASDLPLSVLDFLGEASGEQGLLGRSLFREPTSPRHVFFGNVNLGGLGALAPGGTLLYCPGADAACGAYDASDARLFAPRLASVSPPPGLEALARQVAAASRPAPAGDAMALTLSREARVELAGTDWQLFHGAALALGPGEWLEVEVEIEADGDAPVELEHALQLTRGRRIVHAPLILAPGQTLQLHYSVAPGGELPRLRCRSRARSAGPGRASLALSVQLAVVHHAGRPPEPGAHVLRYEISPLGVDSARPEPLVVMSRAELDAIVGAAAR